MATIIVDVLHDVTDGADGQTTLREAMAAAVATDTIEFHGALAGGTLVLTQGELVINKRLTIDGDVNGDEKADITISGDANGSGVADAGDSRIFSITNGDRGSLKSLTLTNGFGTSQGGALYVQLGGTLDLYDSTISNSVASGVSGGGIFSLGTVNSEANLFIGNSASVYGGAIALSGAGATGNLVDTVVHGNVAGINGGGLSVSNGGTLNIFTSTITGNDADFLGGGIERFLATLNLTNSVVAENTSGAGVPVPDDISGTTDSAVNSFIGTNETVTVNTNSTNGGGDPLLGALQDNGGPILTRNLLPNSPLLDAGDSAAGLVTSLDANGDDRIVGTSIDIGASELQLVVTTLDDDTSFLLDTLAEDLADGNGLSLREAIRHASSGDTITFASELAGGTLRLVNGELVLNKDLNIDGDTNGDDKADITISGDANNDTIANAGDSRIFNVDVGASVDLFSLTITNGFSAFDGGAIVVGSNASLDIFDTTISNSTSSLNGGGIRSNGIVTLTDSLLVGNYAIVQGGGLAFSGATTVATLTNTTLSGNSTNGLGGGISGTSGSKLYLNNSTLTGNIADQDGASTTSGGGIYRDTNDTDVRNSVIAGNLSGLVLADNDVSGTIFVASNSFFGTNTLVSVPTSIINPGGDPGLYVLADNGGTVRTHAIAIDSGLIDAGDNTLVPAGITEDANGTPRIVDGTVDIGATEFRLTVTSLADEAVNGTLAVDATDGAGLSLREAIAHANVGQTVFFEDSLLNTTIVLTNGELALTQDIIIDGDINGDNRADITISGANASRIFNISGATTDVELNSLTLVDGNAGASGGAIYADDANTLIVRDTTIADSFASGVGGGLRIDGTASSFVNVLLTGNSANGAGGGVFLSSNASAIFTNTTIHGNSSNTTGGGVFIGSTAGASFYSSTVTGNEADANGTDPASGGGINNTGTLNIANSVIAENTSGSNLPTPAPNDILGSVNTSFNSFFGTAVTLLNDVLGNSDNGVTINPMLGTLLDNGATTLTRSPLDGSALIGAGVNAALPSDISDIDGDGDFGETLPIDARGFFRTAFGVTDIGAVEQRTDETISGTALDDTIAGGLGNDTLTLIRESAGVEVRLNTGTATGTSTGNDTISGFENVEGSNFNDLIFGDNFSNVLNGNGGNDALFALGADDTVNGGDGNDTLNGNLDGDLLNGDAGDDLVLGAQGNDTLNGGDDNDTVSGGSGDDTVSGGSGADLVFGGGDNDLMFGDGGNDTLSGGGGTDILHGGLNDDLVLGASANDTVNGGAGADTVSGGTGVDVVNGGTGNDQVFGAGGNDTISGGTGDDTVSGGTEDDDISGNAGADSLIGAGGIDRLDGGTGNDILTGGSGADTLVFAVGYEFDTVQGFEDNIDTLELDQTLWGGGLTAAQVVATFATQISPGIVEFDFTGGDILRVVQGAGITTAALVDDIAIV